MLYTIGSFLDIYTLSDFIECTLIIISLFFLFSWLKKDTTALFLPIMYGWFFMLAITEYWNLPTLYLLMIVSTPILAIFLIIFHEERLQKNFVMFKTHYLTCPSIDWVAHLFKCLLTQMHKKHLSIIVIERNDSLRDHLSVQEIIETPLTFTILNLIFHAESKPFTSIWIRADGKIYGSGLSGKKLTSDHDNSYQSLLEYACLLTTHSDALVIRPVAESGLFDLYMNKHYLTAISADHAFRVIKKVLENDKDMSHEITISELKQSSPGI